MVSKTSIITDDVPFNDVVEMLCRQWCVQNKASMDLVSVVASAGLIRSTQLKSDPRFFPTDDRYQSLIVQCVDGSVIAAPVEAGITALGDAVAQVMPQLAMRYDELKEHVRWPERKTDSVQTAKMILNNPVDRQENLIRQRYSTHTDAFTQLARGALTTKSPY